VNCFGAQKTLHGFKTWDGRGCFESDNRGFDELRLERNFYAHSHSDKALEFGWDRVIERASEVLIENNGNEGGHGVFDSMNVFNAFQRERLRRGSFR
jgi:hypothetical protein